MPYSDTAFDEIVSDFIARHQAQHYLDIGAGSGKYARLIRANVPGATIVGIESEGAYIRQFRLRKLYTRLIRQRVERFIDAHPDFVTEIAIIGDCIEHLRKSDGLDLIHFLVYRARYILVIFPTQYVQYSWRCHESEAHRSVWDRSDFRQFEFRMRKKGTMNMAVIRGYLESRGTVYPPEDCDVSGKLSKLGEGRRRRSTD